MSQFTLVHISPTDSPETPIEQTLFYRWLGARLLQTVVFEKLSEAVTVYLDLDLETQRMAKSHIDRLKEIHEHFWYKQYDGVDSQRYMQ